MEKETRSLLGWEEKLERISVIDGRIRKLKDQVKDFEKLKAPLEKDMKKALEDFDQGGSGIHRELQPCDDAPL